MVFQAMPFNKIHELFREHCQARTVVVGFRDHIRQILEVRDVQPWASKVIRSPFAISETAGPQQFVA
jgi:hypothetical protein